MPNWARRRRDYPEPLDYARAVRDRKVVDPIVNFHLRAGFEPIGVLRDYLPGDKESGGRATYIVWRNPYAEGVLTGSSLAHRQKEEVHVATVQYQQRMCSSFKEFISNIEYFIDVCADSRCDFMVMSGNVGNLPRVENMDIQYAQSAILTPCDYPFARDSIAAEVTENVETVTIADLDLTDLSWARAQGTVQNLGDRRFDLYRTVWTGK